MFVDMRNNAFLLSESTIRITIICMLRLYSRDNRDLMLRKMKNWKHC